MSNTTTPGPSSEPAGPEEIFSPEALAYQASYRTRGAMLLRTSPWGRLAYTFMAGTLLAGGLFLALARVPRRLICPSVVRNGRMAASCPAHLEPILAAGAPATVTMVAGSLRVAARVRSVDRGPGPGASVVTLQLEVPGDDDGRAVGFVPGTRGSVEVMSAPVPLVHLLWARND